MLPRSSPLAWRRSAHVCTAAGLAIGAVSIAGCFYLNAASLVAGIGTLAFIQAGRQPAMRRVQATSVGEDLREGLDYVRHTPLVWLVILLVALVGTFGMNLAVLIPVLARDYLQVGAQGFGFLTSAAGLGSLAAALLLAFLPQTPRPEFLLASAAALGVTELALAAVCQYSPALIILGGTGFAMVFFTTLANTVLQRVTPDALRGRVMSVFATVFAGTTPLGSLFAGGLTQNGGWGRPSPRAGRSAWEQRSSPTSPAPSAGAGRRRAPLHPSGPRRGHAEHGGRPRALL